ncbi:MAG: DUF5717 family protein [Defluviitaleaceae bacterium]|nr:DUF5717 family protein [Defluviitaleaceae bacterium]
MEKNLAQLHEVFTAKEDIKTAIIYSLRNWLAYRMQEPGETFYLERAYQGAMVAHRRNVPHVRLFTLAIFMAIEAGHFETASTMLDSAFEYSGFLKSSEPFYYGAFCFLRAYLAIHRQKTRAAKKYRKAYIAHLKNVSYSPYYDVMLGQLHLAANEYTQACDVFSRAYLHGCQSVYLYEGLLRCYKSIEISIDASNQQQGETLLAVLIHAASQGGDVSRAISTNENALYNAIRRNPTGGERLYALSNNTDLLKAICANHIQASNHSLEANKLYVKAAESGVRLSQLGTAVVLSSYFNKIEKVDTHALGQFLENTDLDLQTLVYVYHLLLTDPAHAHLLHSRENVIINTAAKALERGITGRYANSLYQFYWENQEKPAEKEKAETLLEKGLTRYELTASQKTRYIYITQPEKRGTVEYEVIDNYVTIDAAEGFSYVCLGAGKRALVDDEIIIRRVVPLADVALYRHFFDKGNRHFSLLAYLANYYLDGNGDAAAIHVLQALLEDKALQKSYRIQLLVALGHLHSSKNNGRKALDYYSQIDIASLNPEDTQQILDAYLQAKEYSVASNLVACHYKTIPAPALYKALCKLIIANEVQNRDNQRRIFAMEQGSADTAYQEGTQGGADAVPWQKDKLNVTVLEFVSYTQGQKSGLAQAAYSLLLAGYEDEALLNFILDHYNASQSELQALSAALKTPDPRLDMKILSMGLWMHQYDAQIQKAFLRLYATQKAEKECSEFIELMTCAMLTQNLNPEYETINTLEKIYKQTKDMHLLLGLCNVYLSHKITTLRSDSMIAQGIAAQEEKGILLPVFKENKPYPHPFLEKYQPFVYHGQPGKDIRLNYRIGQTADFASIPMEHLRYGLYTAKLPLFYNETVTYFYSEEMQSGSIATKEAYHKNTTPYLNDNHPDTYFAINNAIIYEQMFRHELVEGIVEGLVGDGVEVRARLL